MELADINRREVLRYLGYKNQEADENVSRIVEDCLELLWKNVSPKYRVREFPLTLGADNRIDGEVFQTKSRNLSVNLKDCEKILVFAATLGVGADYLIQKYNRLEMSRAVILQAASAAKVQSRIRGFFFKLPERCFRCTGCRKAPGDQTDRQFSDDAFQIRNSSDRSEPKAPPL